MKGTKYFMVVPLVEIGHFYTLIETDFGFRHKNPGILRGVELENKHGFDSLICLTWDGLRGLNKVDWCCYKLLQNFLMLGAYFLPIF